jgi:hypothetical protein
MSAPDEASKLRSPAAANGRAQQLNNVSGEAAKNIEAAKPGQFAVRDPQGMLASRVFRPTPRGEGTEIAAPDTDADGSEKSERRWRSKAHSSVDDLRQRYAKRADEIEELRRGLAAVLGRDRCHYRRGSRFFLDAPKNNLDRNFVARIWFVANVIERKSWAARAKGKHGGALGPVAMEVLKTLLFVIKKVDGRLYPSLEALAMLSRKSKQSVVTAIGVLERMDFITVHRRAKRIQTPIGIRVVQDSNAYEFHLPTKGLGAIAMALFCPGVSESTRSDAIRPESKTGAQTSSSTTVSPSCQRGLNDSVGGLPIKEPDRWWLHEPLPLGNGGFR